MDTTQILLIIILSLTTVLLIVVGVQLFLVLRDLRKTLQKINTIIDEFEGITGGLENGMAEVIGLVKGVKTVIKLVDYLPKRIHEKKE